MELTLVCQKATVWLLSSITRSLNLCLKTFTGRPLVALPPCKTLGQPTGKYMLAERSVQSFHCALWLPLRNCQQKHPLFAFSLSSFALHLIVRKDKTKQFSRMVPAHLQACKLEANPRPPQFKICMVVTISTISLTEDFEPLRGLSSPVGDLRDLYWQVRVKVGALTLPPG